MPGRPRIVAFDIIGTLFDLAPLRLPLEAAGLPDSSLDLWFAQGLRDAFALAASGRYAPFRAILESALVGVLARHGADRSSDRVAAVFNEMAKLPPHADAADALRILGEGGLRVMALSNGSPAFVANLLDRSGLSGGFERIVSVDDAQCLKPRPEVYRYAAEAAGVDAGELALVATHAWDIHGAGSAGLVTGYVARGKPYPPVMRAPEVVGESLVEVARKLVDLPVDA